MFISGKRCLVYRKRRGAAEVISSLLLVAVTIVGAVILTSFLDETFVAGSLGSTSGTESSIKSIKLIAFDSRDGSNLMNIANLNNTIPTDQVLTRESATFPNDSPKDGGTDFIVIQIENSGVNPIFVHNVYLDGVNHTWDSSTSNVELNPDGSFNNGDFPGDGKFSIISTSKRCGGNNFLIQCDENQILNGETVNLIIKLDNENEDIPLSKTIRTQFNIGDNQLSELLIESGGAQ